MFSFLKNHPFAVSAFFEKSIVFTFAVKKEELENLIPATLQLDSFDDKWGFVAVAMVQTKSLRPKALPQFMGNDFFLIGYRVFVRYTNAEGKRLRGLYILHSETNKMKMQVFGNIFTHYNYSTTDINLSVSENKIKINSKQSEFKIDVESGLDYIALPFGSPFTDWQTARRFAGPLPFTFTVNEKKKEILIIEGVRKDWKPMPLKVNDYYFSFIKKLNLSNVILANAFIINQIPYYWKKGKVEKWNH